MTNEEVVDRFEIYGLVAAQQANSEKEITDGTEEEEDDSWKIKRDHHQKLLQQH